MIQGTGVGTDTPGSFRDSNWKVVAIPQGWSPPDSQFAPYDSYVIPNVPGVFYGGINGDGYGEQLGATFSGIQNYWIAPHNSDASLFPWNGGWTSYNWIVAQTFTIETAGIYDFSFQGAGDNALDFYIDGSITNFENDPLRPTIAGGTQIGTRAGGFGYLTTFTGAAYLTEGEHTAYMVLWDYGGSTGALIGQSSFVSAVPEPASLFGTALVLCGGSLLRFRRRRRD